jgi:YVTN family beta-propeller protein
LEFTNFNAPGSGTVSVIDTSNNALTATVPVGLNPGGLAVTPDGKQVYITNGGTNTISVLDTFSNAVVTAFAVGNYPYNIAFTPDGKRAYVPHTDNTGTLSVIDTTTHIVVATLQVGIDARGVAVTPDGKRVYVTSVGLDQVSVIDTASNTVVATVAVGANPIEVSIIPPPPGIPFSAFSAKLENHFGHKPNTDHFNLNASFTLGSAGNGINPPTEPITLTVGTFSTTIPPGSFRIADDQDDQNDQEEGVGMKRFGPFRFQGVIDGVDLRVLIRPTGAKRYALDAEARHADLTGTKNPVPVTLAIGGDSGTTLVDAHINQYRDDD